jgi:hypothetical protein
MILKNLFRIFDFSDKEVLGDGYSNINFIEAIIRKNVRYMEEVETNKAISLAGMRTLIPFALGEFGTDIEVLDFGGGGGKHYVDAKAGMPRKRFKWTILETPEMVRECRLKIRFGNELNFIDNLDKLENAKLDLVFANSSLQYTDEPILQLEKILSLGSRYIFITRTVLSEDQPNVFYQKSKVKENGPSLFEVDSDDRNVSYKVTAATKLQFEHTLSTKYEIKLKIVEEKGAYRNNGQEFNVYGYFCERK